MIDILHEIIKILHKKMLQAINLYWFYNDASEKDTSQMVIPTNLEEVNKGSSYPLLNKISFIQQKSRKKKILAKNQYRGGSCLKGGGGVWTVCRFKWEGGLARKRGVFSRGEVDTPTQTMWWYCKVAAVKQISGLLNW